MKKLIFILFLFPFVLFGQKLQDRAEAIWDLESTAYYDSTGNGHDGTATGTVNINSTGGLLGSYMETDGSGGDYVDVGAIAIGNKWTWSIWVWLDDVDDDHRILGRFYGDFEIYVNSSDNWAYTVFGNYLSSSTSAATGQWVHLVLTYDNSLGSNNLKFYVNGTLVSQHNITTAETRSTSNWQFAANGNGSYDLDGRIDAPAVWKEVLDGTTIDDTLYKDGSPTYSYQWTPEPAPEGYGFDEQMYSSDLGIGFYPIHSATGEPFQIFEYTSYSPPATPSENPYDSGTVEYTNHNMGAGVNIWKVAGSDWELDWTDSIFYVISQKGFGHVRGVMEVSNTDYAIDATRITNLKEIIDSTVSNGMIFLFDYHIAPPWWNPLTAAEKDSLASHWAQFSRELSTYTREQVIFDIVNEPGGLVQDISVSDWNALTARVVDSIRAYDTDRIVAVSPLEWGHVEALTGGFEIPSDTSLILTLHFYEPNWVVSQNFWNDEDTVFQNTDWLKIKPLYDDLKRRFAPLDSFLVDNDIPVNIGEYGTNAFVDSTNRENYYLMFKTLAANEGWSFSKWDLVYDFGLRNSPDVLGGAERWFDYLVDAIISDTLVFDSYDSIAIHDYSSGFTSGDESDFGTYTAGSGAISALSVSGGDLVCEVTGTDYSHLNVRLYLPTMNLVKNETYRITVTWRSSNLKEEMALKFSGDHTWNYIYDINTTSVTQQFTLTMPNNTQTSSRIELLLGYGTGTIYIEDLLIEKLTVN